MTSDGQEGDILTRSLPQLLRVKSKLLLREVKLLPAFCKRCGRPVRDFIAPDQVWEQVEPLILDGAVLCYDCFCDACSQIGTPSVWELRE